jgi:hypothetical protein
MSKFTDFIDGLKDGSGKLAKDELKNLIATAKQNESDFVRLQATNIERWVVMLADQDLTPDGFKKLVRNIEVLKELDNIKLKVQAKAAAQRLADGIQDLVINGLFALI